MTNENVSAARLELSDLLKAEDERAMVLAKMFCAVAGDASPMAMWAATTTLATLAIRRLEDHDPPGSEGVGKLVCAELKANFIAKLMTRDLNGR
jgi:hypothetical protein